ncbi:hypothetical protein RRG08_030184 [Elysia crispata]|uniref:Uncharacterized protein n=1 Tax=Elysia crispata TaxID=231223 RepID=A0AAE0ZT54_9GAST|nr:hypothetical protein RRG08_030184 [Elysia crispata]
MLLEDLGWKGLGVSSCEMMVREGAASFSPLSSLTHLSIPFSPPSSSNQEVGNMTAIQCQPVSGEAAVYWVYSGNDRSPGLVPWGETPLSAWLQTADCGLRDGSVYSRLLMQPLLSQGWNDRRLEEFTS